MPGEMKFIKLPSGKFVNLDKIQAADPRYPTCDKNQGEIFIVWADGEGDFLGSPDSDALIRALNEIWLEDMSNG